MRCHPAIASVRSRNVSGLLFCPGEFAAKRNRLSVGTDEGELDPVVVRVDRGEYHVLEVPPSGAARDVEKTKRERLPVLRHLPFETRPVAGVAVVSREQALTVDVEHG